MEEIIYISANIFHYMHYNYVQYLQLDPDKQHELPAATYSWSFSSSSILTQNSKRTETNWSHI